MKLMNKNINEILFAREQKQLDIQMFLERYVTVLVLSINYPGPDKCNSYSKFVYNQASQKIKQLFKIESEIYKEGYAGYYGVFGLKEESGKAKLKSIELEDLWELGRLIDLDIYDYELGLLNRIEFNKENRKCFICNQEAKICGRNRTHSVDELISYFQRSVNQYKRSYMEKENEIMELHRREKGLLEMQSLFHVENKEDLSKAYTPGISAICKAIATNELVADEETIKGKMVAVISDGSAVLGLGDIGNKASLPVIEGKSLLYKELANVNAFPICIKQGAVNEMVQTIYNISDSFAAIHLEDFKAPECFEIEEKLQSMCDIAVYHDDEHGTAIALLAALVNACKLTKRDFSKLKVVMCGVGASGLASAKLLYEAGIHKIVLVDRVGIITEDNASNSYQKEFAKIVNPTKQEGSLHEALEDADVFVGLSDANVMTNYDVKQMKKDSIIFALANPIPEINPTVAKDAGAYIVGTGSSKYPNQINNVLVFPGLFKGLLQRRDIKKVSNSLKIEIANALANLSNELDEEHIIVNVFDQRVVSTIEKIVLNYRE